MKRTVLILSILALVLWGAVALTLPSLLAGISQSKMLSAICSPRCQAARSGEDFLINTSYILFGSSVLITLGGWISSLVYTANIRQWNWLVWMLCFFMMSLLIATVLWKTLDISLTGGEFAVVGVSFLLFPLGSLIYGIIGPISAPHHHGIPSHT
jgi:hypothetical protein